MGVILLSLFVSLVVMIGRHQIEQASPDVEVVLDWSSLQDLQKVVRQPMPDLLQSFKDSGVTSVAIYEKKLIDYVKDNQVVILDGQDLLREYFLNGEINPVVNGLYDEDFRASMNNIFLIFQDKATYNKLYTLIEDLPDYLIKGTKDLAKNLYVIEIEDGDSEFLDIPLGFSDCEIEMINEAGLRLIPRFSDTKEELAMLPDILQDLQSKGEISKIIFAGVSILGNPNHLKETADILKDYTVGMIEPFIGYQEGIRELAVIKDFEIVRVHSLQQKEMDKYSYEKVLDRYIRAIKERNVRVVYLRPFLTEKGAEKPLALNLRLIKDLQNNLSKSGYRLGVAKPFSEWRTGIVWIGLISLGVIAASLLLVNRFIVLPDWLDYGLVVLGGLGTFILASKGYVLQTRDLLALVASFVLPSLAVIEGFQGLIKENNGVEKRKAKVILQFIKITGITSIGVLYVVGLLSDLRYLYQINQFRGIKLSFVLPLLIIALYYLKEHLFAKDVTKTAGMLKNGFTWLNQPVRYSHLMIFGLIGIVGILYIGRTGNFPILPIPALELTLRDFLEKLLVFRPRFKEFAIGHPFMLLALYYGIKNKGKWLLPLMILGSIGQINIVNTFAHIHTPVIVSIVRTLWGAVLGILLGLILIMVYQIGSKLWRKMRRFVYE